MKSLSFLFLQYPFSRTAKTDQTVGFFEKLWKCKFLRQSIQQLIQLINALEKSKMFVSSNIHPTNDEIVSLSAYAMHLPFNYSILQQLWNNQQSLRKEVQQMQNTVNVLTHRLKMMKNDESSQAGNKNNDNCLNGQKSKKIFKKDKLCPFANCDKKYSSNIALNSHLRKVHNRKSQPL